MDQKTEPDDDCYKCDFCGLQTGGKNSLMRHVSRCPENEGIEAPEPYPEED